MSMITDLRPQHRRALTATGEAIDRSQAGDLSRRTPCAGWDLGMLLAHLIGQNRGFARAVSTGDAPESAYAAAAIGPGGASQAWTESAEVVRTAFADADLEHQVRLVEIDPDGAFSVAAVVGMHLLDTLIHTWDVSTSLGHPYRPDDDLVGVVAVLAARVPAGNARTVSGAAFAPVVATSDADAWLTALALLGRSNPAG